jgi:hypothetical protein
VVLLLHHHHHHLWEAQVAHPLLLHHHPWAAADHPLHLHHQAWEVVVHLPLLYLLVAPLLVAPTSWRVFVAPEALELCARLVAPTVRLRVAPSLLLHLRKKKGAVATWRLPWRLLFRCASLVLLEAMMRTRLTMRTGTIKVKMGSESWF